MLMNKLVVRTNWYKQNKIGSEFYPEDRMNINYATNNYNEAFKEIVNFNKDYNGLPHNIKPYLNHRTFKSSSRMYVFDTR